MISRDQILTNVSLYWPTGVYSGPPGIRRLAEQHNTIIHRPEDNPAGHHFVAMDQPGPLAGG